MNTLMKRKKMMEAKKMKLEYKHKHGHGDEHKYGHDKGRGRVSPEDQKCAMSFEKTGTCGPFKRDSLQESPARSLQAKLDAAKIAKLADCAKACQYDTGNLVTAAITAQTSGKPLDPSVVKDFCTKFFDKCAMTSKEKACTDVKAILSEVNGAFCKSGTERDDGGNMKCVYMNVLKRTDESGKTRFRDPSKYETKEIYDPITK